MRTRSARATLHAPFLRHRCYFATTSYDKLRDLIPEVGGYPRLSAAKAGDWLGGLIRDGATFSNQYYDLLIDHDNLAVGVRNPPAGLDRVSQEAIAKCPARATVGIAIVFDRAFAETAVTPPVVDLSAKEVKAALQWAFHALSGMRQGLASGGRQSLIVIRSTGADQGIDIPRSSNTHSGSHAPFVNVTPRTLTGREQKAKCFVPSNDGQTRLVTGRELSGRVRRSPA